MSDPTRKASEHENSLRPAEPAADAAPAKEAAPCASDKTYSCDSKHTDRELHYLLFERSAALPPRRPSCWRRLVEWLTG